MSGKDVLLLVAVCLAYIGCSALGNSELPCDIFTPNYVTKSETDCQHYWSCENGVLKEEKCPWMQEFDPAETKCQLTGVNCKAVPRPIPEAWPRFDCTGRPDFKTNSPWGCKYFIQCSGGKLSTDSCPWYQPRFKPSSQDCWSVYSYVCDLNPYPPPDVTTTVVPTTTTVTPTPTATSQPTTPTTPTTPTIPTTETSTEGPTESTTESTTEASNETSSVDTTEM